MRLSRFLLITLGATSLFYVVLLLILFALPISLETVVPNGTLMQKMAFVFDRIVRSGAIVLAVALSVFLLCQVPFINRRRISHKKPGPAQYGREIFLNINTFLAAGVQSCFYILAKEVGLSQVYQDTGERGYIYAIFSVVAYFVLADIWFYFFHRLSHYIGFIFRSVHRVHHMSVTTTPLTSNAGSPFEYITSGSFSLVFIMLVPISASLLFVSVMAAIVYQHLLHAGFEIFPQGTARHWLGKWLITPTYHQMHHELYLKHMSLYFTWLDRVAGTYSDAYERRFDDATNARQPLATRSDSRLSVK